MTTARRTAEDRQPKYLRIHAELRDRITSGQWPAGTSLPAQRDLAAEFGVSIMTLRQALQLLADDGLIAARHGSGTYVAARYEYDLGHLRSFAADLAAQGAEIRTRLLAAEIITPADEVSARLGGPGQVLRLRRLRLAGSRPLILQTSYLPLPLADGLDPADLAERGLYTVLAEHGRVTSNARPGARRCSATGSASPRTAWPWWTITRCSPATVSRSPPTGPPIAWTSTTPCIPVHPGIPACEPPAAPAGSRTGTQGLRPRRRHPSGHLGEYARPRAREDVAGLHRGKTLLYQAKTMAVWPGLDRDLHRGAEARGVGVHRGHVVGQPVRPLDRRDHPLLPEGWPIRHLEGHRPAPAGSQIELGVGDPVRPLAVVQRDEGVEDRFRWGVDDALNAEPMPVALACR